MFNKQRSFFGPTYEDFQPLVQTRETPESYLLLIHLPGFAREQIGAKFDSSNRRVKVFGERPLGNNRWCRFSLLYPIPESCEASKLHRKFDGETVTITMPKKVISKAGAKEELELPTEQAAPEPPLFTTESKPAASVEKANVIAAEGKARKGQEGISQKPKSTIGSSQRQADEKKVESSIPPKATTGDSMTQKGQEGVHRKSTLTMDKKSQTDHENLEGSVVENGEQRRDEKKETKEDIGKTSEVRKPTEKPQEVIPPKPTTRVEKRKAITAEVKAQKGQEGIHPKDALRTDKNKQPGENLTGSVVENEEKKKVENKETKEDIGKTSGVGKPSENAQESIPAKDTTRVEEGKATTAVVEAQKGQEGIHQKGTSTTDKKNKLVEKLAGSVAENGGKLSVENQKAKNSEVENPPDEKAVWDVSFAGKESKKEKKESSTNAAESCTPREKEKIGKFGNLDEGVKGLKDIINAKGKEIKEAAASASQAVTRMTKKFYEEDKQMMIYMGAAVIVATAALGVCASYRFRSFARP